MLECLDAWGLMPASPWRLDCQAATFYAYPELAVYWTRQASLGLTSGHG